MAEGSFQVVPAVDLLGDEAVRLEQGDFGRVAVRAQPEELVRRFAARGWLEHTGLDAVEVVRRCAEAGVSRILCTAIERDGMLGGPDLDLLRGVRGASGLPVLAAGGIRSESDLAAVAAVGCEGAVVGRALLDGSLPLSAVVGREPDQQFPRRR